MKKIYYFFMVAFVWLASQTMLSAQTYHFQYNFDIDASDNFEGWETNKASGGSGVAATTSSSFCNSGKGLKFRDTLASINTLSSYANAGVLEFYLFGGNSFSSDPNPVLTLFVSTDKINWESVYSITHSALEDSMALSGLLYLKKSIELNKTDAIYIKFESLSADDGKYPFGVDDVSLTNTVSILDDNTEVASVNTENITVSYENILFTDDGTGLFLANDSVSLSEAVILTAIPLDERATVVFTKQADPEAGKSDTAVFTVNAFDGITSKDYKVVISRSVYQCKQGFVGRGDASGVAGGGWKSTGGFYATDSKGNGGLFPGINAMRLYRSGANGPGSLTSPEFSMVGSISFSAKFSITDDESLTVQKSLDQGATWIDVKTFTPAGGEFPSYPTEDIADILARQKVEINALNAMIRFQFNGTSTAPRTLIDDILIDADADIDDIAPVLSNVTAGSVLQGEDVSATSNEDGAIYLVPEGTEKTVEAITAAKVADATATADVAVTLSTTGITVGNYVVYAIDAAQNISDASALITVISTVGISNDNSHSVRIYPNPASDYINISGNPSEVLIYNVTGNLVLHVSNSNNINIKSLSKGIYFVKVNRKVQKIVVE